MWTLLSLLRKISGVFNVTLKILARKCQLFTRNLLGWQHVKNKWPPISNSNRIKIKLKLLLSLQQMLSCSGSLRLAVFFVFKFLYRCLITFDLFSFLAWVPDTLSPPIWILIFNKKVMVGDMFNWSCMANWKPRSYCCAISVGHSSDLNSLDTGVFLKSNFWSPDVYCLKVFISILNFNFLPKIASCLSPKGGYW